MTNAEVEVIVAPTPETAPESVQVGGEETPATVAVAVAAEAEAEGKSKKRLRIRRPRPPAVPGTEGAVEQVKKERKRRSRLRRPLVAKVTASTGEPGKKEKKRARPRQFQFALERRRNARKLWFVRPGVPKMTVEEQDELVNQLSDLTLVENVNVCDRFEDMGLKPEVLRGIYGLGLEKPSLIQQQAIALGMAQKDIIVQAQSGMGKTVALVVTVLQRIDPEDKNCQALIVVPTRELAVQVTKVFEEMSKFIEPKVSVYCCAGGNDRNKCIESLESGQQIVIGTVGRTMDMIVGNKAEKYLNLKSLKIFALDEADQLLDGNFGRDLTTIIERIPPPKQTQVVLMSATMPEKILKIAHRFMLHPLKILVRNHQLTLDGIRQFHVKVNEVDKVSTLADLYGTIEKARGMIFCNTRKTVDFVKAKMLEHGLELQSLTSDFVQSKRDDIMDKLRLGAEGYKIIITSDLLGRGIDIQQVNLVVNYDIPSIKESYIHRVGRAGRYGRKGIALTFVNEEQDKEFRMLEEFYETEIQAMPATSDFDSLLTESTA